MKIRVYYEDTDCGDVVYYANYLRYMERSRTEFMRERGIDIMQYHKKGYLFAVIEAHVTYRHAARYNDLLDVESFLKEHTSLTLTFDTVIHNQQGKLCVQGYTRLICLSRDTGKVCKIPIPLIDVLADKTKLVPV